MNEVERIKRVYGQRQREGLDALYTLFNDAHLYRIQGREREILKILRREGSIPLEDKRILDIGCGDGSELRRFLAYGARPENLCGIDLLWERVVFAKKTNPRIHVSLGNAGTLPFASGSFDLAMQFTVFTSVLDRRLRQEIAHEMVRVLKPHGLIIWYDFWVSNPRNPHVRGIQCKGIKALFPDCRFKFRRITLAPPVTQALARRSWLACYLLERIPLMRTHYLATIKVNHPES